MKLKYDGKKPKHTAGKTKKCRCLMKRSGCKCSCGSIGKKLFRLPFPYKEDERFIRKCRKWKKKHGIEIVKRVKEKFE